MGDDDAIQYTEKVYFSINTIIKKKSCKSDIVAIDPCKHTCSNSTL